jgi:hypothetical protein
MSVAVFLLLAACATNEPGGGSAGDDSSPPADDTGTPPADDTGTECTPVDYYVDLDHDGFGTGDLLSACDPVDAADVDGDCDDTNADVHPDREEVCNAIDDDCDLDIDENGETTLYYPDDDGDGYGAADGTPLETCGAVPSGYVLTNADCDDANDGVYPGAGAEIWTDGVDSDCDGVFESEVPVDVPEATGQAWDAPTASTPELRILGVYEAGGSGREVAVLHDVPEAVVLVLASYGPVNWVVTETYPGTIQEIHYTGYSGSTAVTAPKSAVVSAHLGAMRWSASAFDWDDLETRTLVDAAEAATGLSVTSFHGAYNPPSFTISPAVEWLDVSAYPDCTKKTAGTLGGDPDPTALDPAACAAVLKNDHVCLVSTGSTLDAYGLESGDSCTAATFTSPFTEGYSNTIAWSDEYVYTCFGEHGLLQRASLLTGAVEKSYVYCSGVAFLDGEIYARAKDGWSGAALYETWADAQCGSPVGALGTTSNSNIAIRDSILYSTSGSTNEFAWQEVDGSSSGSLPIEGYEDWIWGISVTDDGWFALLGRDGIQWHDVTDGEYLGGLGAPMYAYGLTCATP